MNMYDNLSGCLGSYDMQTYQILSSYNVRHKNCDERKMAKNAQKRAK